MYINTTEERYFKTFLSNNSGLRPAIEKLLSAGRYKELTESDRFLLHSLGFKGVFSEEGAVDQEIGHKTLQFISYLYELSEVEYLQLIRAARAFEKIEEAIRAKYLGNKQLDKSKFYCVYNPTNARLPLTAKNNKLELGEGIQVELDYLLKHALRSSEGVWEATVLATYTLRNSHLTDFTENMVIFHVDGCPFFIMVDNEE